MTTDPEPLSAAQVVPFLRSVIISGERLSLADVDAIAAALDEARATPSGDLAAALARIEGLAWSDTYHALREEGVAEDRAMAHADIVRNALTDRHAPILAAFHQSRSVSADSTAGLDVDAIARAMTWVRSAHNGPDDLNRDDPCEWCRLAARQAVEAIRLVPSLSPSTPPETGAAPVSGGAEGDSPYPDHADMSVDEDTERWKK